MDIRRWLAETVERAPATFPPRSSERLDARTALHCEQPKYGSSSKRPRKRPKSDSSLLDPEPLPVKTRANQRKPSGKSATDDCAYTGNSDPTRSEISLVSISSHRYERRPRRKTRPERYEPSSKVIDKRPKHAHRDRNREPNRRRDEPRSSRKKGDNPGSGIGQTFRAKHVSGDRLTVRAAIYAVTWRHTDDWPS